jgi:hypothetical protein
VPLLREKGWWERNWKWAVPVSAVALVVLFVAALLAVVFGAFRSSYVYQEVLTRARASPAVVEQLGTPIEPSKFVSGSINISGDSGDADLSIPVSGPKGSGTLYARAEKRAGEWHFSLLAFVSGNGQLRIDLLKEPGPQDRQRF